jgi:hypothetical protein
VRSLAAGDAEGVGGRVGYRYDASAPYSVFSDLPLGEFLDLSRRIHERVAGRPVVIASAIGTRGHWYFFADLRPHMPDPEPSMTILNNRMRAHYLAQLEQAGIPCVVSTRPVDTELRIFPAQPGERDEWLLPTSERDFYVACMREPAALAARESAHSAAAAPASGSFAARPRRSPRAE